MKAAAAAIPLVLIALMLAREPKARAQSPARDRPTPVSAVGAIRGRIVSVDNAEPVRRARVELTGGIGEPQEPIYSDNEGRFTFTNVAAGRGEYRTGGLPGGTFVVNAFGWAGPSVALPGSGIAPRPYSTFFPHTPFLGQARAVAVRPGEELSAIDVGYTQETMVTPTVSG